MINCVFFITEQNSSSYQSHSGRYSATIQHPPSVNNAPPALKSLINSARIHTNLKPLPNRPPTGNSRTGPGRTRPGMTLHLPLPGQKSTFTTRYVCSALSTPAFGVEQCRGSLRDGFLYATQPVSRPQARAWTTPDPMKTSMLGQAMPVRVNDLFMNNVTFYFTSPLVCRRAKQKSGGERVEKWNKIKIM